MTISVKGRLVARMARLAVAGLVLLFIYTGTSKLLSLQEFTGTLYNQPLPHWMAPVLARLIPALEIGTALLLMYAPAQLAGLRISLFLLILFSGYTAAILLHLFPKIPCTCGGIFRFLSWKQHLFINLGLVGITGFALYAKRKPRSISSPLKPSL